MDDPNCPKLRLVVVFLALGMASLFLAACGPMEIEEQVPAPLTEMQEMDESKPAEHDLGILAIDFDPPLDRTEMWAQREQVTLLIAVENRGLSQEEGAEVTAKLADLQETETLLKQSTTLAGLAPGEVEVVRFCGISDLPYRRAYRLEVEVSPCDGEWALADNAKVYDLTIKEPAPAQASRFTSPLMAP